MRAWIGALVLAGGCARTVVVPAVAPYRPPAAPAPALAPPRRALFAPLGPPAASDLDQIAHGGRRAGAAPPQLSPALVAFTLADGELATYVRQDMTGAPDAADNQSYGGAVRFHVQLDAERVLVTLRIHAEAVTMASWARWRGAVLTRWNDRAALTVAAPDGARRYPIVLDMVWVGAARAHQEVTLVARTLNMTEWGPEGDAGIAHEVGHMLGNPDEYNTVDGITYGPESYTTSIMAIGYGPTLPRHYELVRRAAARILAVPETACGIVTYDN